MLRNTAMEENMSDVPDSQLHSRADRRLKWASLLRLEWEFLEQLWAGGPAFEVEV
jgi:hypothetical protein